MTLEEQTQCLTERLDLAQAALDNARIDAAILFATQCHAGQLRKGTTLPYILHPLEVFQILSTMQADTDLMIAGLLHDTVEDTDATIAEIAARFGDRVAQLVDHHSEDKSQVWLARKNKAIAMLHEADRPLKTLVLADKLSNLRSIDRDYQTLGDDLWQRFHAPKEKQAWYYNGMIDALSELQQYPETADAYQELVEHYKNVFVLYKIAPTYDRLYQANAFGQAYCLTKGNPQWMPVNYRFRQNDIPLTRQEAESLEDKWYDLFLGVVEQDLQDAVYPLYHTPDQHAQLILHNGGLQLLQQQNGMDTTIQLNEEDTYQALTALRTQYGIAAPLAQIILQAFGHKDCLAHFQQFCTQYGLGN